MRVRSALLIGSLSLFMPALAQAAGPYKAPTNPWGRPDLEGNWTNTSLTRLGSWADRMSIFLERLSEARDPSRESRKLFLRWCGVTHPSKEEVGE